jgi:putative two-component system protein, hydrogenase maturation factor HypX/HoxX
MRILLISSSYNGLCQRAHVELDNLGHDISIALALSAEEVRNAVDLFQPDLIICPFLKEKIPDNVYKTHLCIILHPGIKGDRGPSSLDWAITNGETEWGATALQADEEMDAGYIWASHNFPMRQASKASLYRREITQVAIKGMLETVRRFESRNFTPEPLDYSKPEVRGQLRPPMKQKDRAINWSTDTVETIIRKINAGDSAPGVLDSINSEEFYLYGAHEESQLRGSKPGEIIAKRHGAICRAAVEGAVWISHLRRKNNDKLPFHERVVARKRSPHDFKLPAAMVLGDALNEVPESPVDPLYMGTEKTFKEIWYEEINQVGYLHFDFHNGAMSTEQCQRLLESYWLALKRPIRVIVLRGGTDFWSNGINLNIIEAADSPADESWRNINAIDDVVYEIATTGSHLTVSALWGGAGAGGAMMPLAADYIWAREGCIMNPHYKTMGLYGSEYWTYLLPRRVGPGRALELTEIPLPIGMKKAKTIGMIDEILPDDYNEFQRQLRCKAEALASSPDYDALLAEKRKRRAADEAIKPLAAYRAAELQHMRMNFFGKFYGAAYHEARYNFVHKVRPKETAKYLAKHLCLDTSRFDELRQPLAY